MIKHATRYFLALALFVLAILLVTTLLDFLNFGEQNFGAWLLMLVAIPAVIFRKVVGIESYVSSLGLADVIGLIVFYFLICLLAAWVANRFRSK